MGSPRSNEKRLNVSCKQTNFLRITIRTSLMTDYPIIFACNQRASLFNTYRVFSINPIITVPKANDFIFNFLIIITYYYVILIDIIQCHGEIKTLYLD